MRLRFGGGSRPSFVLGLLVAFVSTSAVASLADGVFPSVFFEQGCLLRILRLTQEKGPSFREEATHVGHTGKEADEFVRRSVRLSVLAEDTLRAKSERRLTGHLLERLDSWGLLRKGDEHTLLGEMCREFGRKVLLSAKGIDDNASARCPVVVSLLVKSNPRTMPRAQNLRRLLALRAWLAERRMVAYRELVDRLPLSLELDNVIDSELGQKLVREIFEEVYVAEMPVFASWYRPTQFARSRFERASRSDSARLDETELADGEMIFRALRDSDRVLESVRDDLLREKAWREQVGLPFDVAWYAMLADTYQYFRP